MPDVRGTAMPSHPPTERPTLQQRLKAQHPLVSPGEHSPVHDASGEPEESETTANCPEAIRHATAAGVEHGYAFDQEAINATVRRALDQLPLANVVDNLIAALRWHIGTLVPVIEAKDRGPVVDVILGEVRAKVAAAPAAGTQAIERAVYAQELARTCRALVPLAAIDPAGERQHPLVLSARTHRDPGGGGWGTAETCVGLSAVPGGGR